MSSCGDPNCKGCINAAALADTLLQGEDPAIPVDKQIVGFMHCVKCMKEKPGNVSPEKWARLNVGFTPNGLQVWCVRHEKNVMHLDFHGHRLTVNLAPDQPS